MTVSEDILHETEHYKVIIGLSPWGSFDHASSSQYLIVNKETGVVEAEHRVKAYALAWSEQFEELQKAFYDNKPVNRDVLHIPSFEGIPTPPPPTD